MVRPVERPGAELDEISVTSAGPPALLEFRAEPDPSEELCAAAADLAPTNHSYTWAYVQSMRRLRYQPWMLSLLGPGGMTAACPAFLASGRINRSLEIVSLPVLPEGPAGAPFWEGLLRLCREARVSHVTIGSFDSAAAEIPALPGEIARKRRSEFVLDLASPQLWGSLASNHLRNVKSARKSGLQLRTSVDADGCRIHAEMLQASMDRRKRRGETVSGETQAQYHLAFTGSGAGVIYQMVLGDKVLSSLLVLRAPRGAYYQSAGTSPDGMSLGASHFLVHEIAGRLREEGVMQFNLGGASPRNPGLQRFKRGFGAAERQLDAAELYLGTRLRRALTGAATYVRDRIRPSRRTR